MVAQSTRATPVYQPTPTGTPMDAGAQEYNIDDVKQTRVDRSNSYPFRRARNLQQNGGVGMYTQFRQRPVETPQSVTGARNVLDVSARAGLVPVYSTIRPRLGSQGSGRGGLSRRSIPTRTSRVVIPQQQNVEYNHDTQRNLVPNFDEQVTPEPRKPTEVKFKGPQGDTQDGRHTSDRIEELQHQLELLQTQLFSLQDLKDENSELREQLEETKQQVAVERREKEELKIRNETHKAKQSKMPNVKMVNEIVKRVKDRGLKLVDKAQWEDLKEFLEGVVYMYDWPKYLIDLDGPTWTPKQPEDAFQAKSRKEFFMLLCDSIDWKKHGSKLDTIMVDKKIQDAQAVWRRLDSFFGLGKVHGDVSNMGTKLRECTMKSTGLPVIEYGLELLRREKALNNVGVYTSHSLELIPMYLNGLIRSFDRIRETIFEERIKDPEKYTHLRDVIDHVEHRATLANIINHVYRKGGTTTQLSQTSTTSTPSDSQKGKKKDKKKKKDSKEEIKQLKQEIADLKKKTNSTKTGDTQQLQQGTNSTEGKRECKYGKDCFNNNCTYKHPASRKKCTKCGFYGHAEPKCGKCYICGQGGHHSRECPKRSTEGQSFQGSQVMRSADDNPKVRYRFGPPSRE